ncbi:MAG: hypothetical protein WD689_05145 [Gaiellaceae bacterium]
MSALPPEQRTVGQLVAETIQAYRNHVLGAFALGIPAAVVDVVGTELDRTTWFLISPVAGALFLTPAYIGAVLLVSGARPGRRAIVTAFAAGALAFLPFPFLAAIFILPGLAWFALVGLCVPVALLERRGVQDSFARAYRLARADYVHVLGGLATLALVVFLTRTVLFFLLRDLGDSTSVVASVLADIVISPILFLGAALLYDDQVARAVDSAPSTTREA